MLGGTDKDRSAAYDFLLTFHNNYWHILYTVSESNGNLSQNRKFFPLRVFSDALNGFPLELDNTGRHRETGVTGLPGRERSLTTCLADTIHECDRQTDRRTPADSKCRAYAERRAVKIIIRSFIFVLVFVLANECYTAAVR